MTLKMYEKYGAGTVVESTEVNWKMDSDPSHMYYFYPVKRPVANAYESDLSCSVSKVNYFRVTGATKITEPKLVICSPVKTQIVINTDGTGYSQIIYGGSGYSDGLTFDPAVGALKRQNAAGEFEFEKFPAMLPKTDKDENTVNPNPLIAAKLAAIATTTTGYGPNIPPSGYTLNSDGKSYQSDIINDFKFQMSESNDKSLKLFAEDFATAAAVLAKPGIVEYLPDHLFIDKDFCVRIDIMTGSAVSLVMLKPRAPGKEVKGSGTPGTEIAEDMKASSTYLYAGINNTYVQPTTDYKHNLKFVSTGNMVIDLPLGTSPETATTMQEEYTGADLFSPYIESQLRCAASTYADVGNSPQYRLVFMCKIFN